MKASTIQWQTSWIQCEIITNLIKSSISSWIECCLLKQETFTLDDSIEEIFTSQLAKHCCWAHWMSLWDYSWWILAKLLSNRDNNLELDRMFMSTSSTNRECTPNKFLFPSPQLNSQKFSSTVASSQAMLPNSYKLPTSRNSAASCNIQWFTGTWILWKEQFSFN